jgi:hypothetical protein
MESEPVTGTGAGLGGGDPCRWVWLRLNKYYEMLYEFDKASNEDSVVEVFTE